MQLPDATVLLKNIEYLGSVYREKYLTSVWHNLESDWFEGLKFFFAHSFMRGRRDEVSHEFYSFAINRLLNDILHSEDGGTDYSRLQERANEFDIEFLLNFKRKYGLGKKTASKHDKFAEEVAGQHEIIRLLTTPKAVPVCWEGETYTKVIKLSNDEDVLMVLDTLKFISDKKRQNIYTYLLSSIAESGVRPAYAELTKLRAVKDKIATLVIRDIGIMNYGLIQEDFAGAFPVDTWVKRLAGKLGCLATNDHGIKAYFIEKCREASIDPLLFAAGLWFLGFHSLDILLGQYLGRYHISGAMG